MPASAAPRHVSIDAVFERLFNEIPAATLNALGGAPSQLSWRDFIDVPEWGTPAGAKWVFLGAEDARAEWAKIREGRTANIALVRTWRVFRYMQRASSRGTRWKDLDKLVPQAEAHVSRLVARLARRYPLITAEPPPHTDAAVVFRLTEIADAIRQAGTVTLHSQNARGELEIVNPVGCRLWFCSDRDYPEWVVVMVANNPKDLRNFSATWRRLCLTHEDADALVAEVKQSLRLPVPTPSPTEPQGADSVGPELRALADQLFEHWRQQPDRRITCNEWQKRALIEGWATHKRTIVNAYGLVFKTKKNAPPKAGWPLQDHYERELQARLSAESVSTDQTL
jgi:hypothetical protein